ncbi:MAG: hypothetical protein JF586_15640 [Burkholderiales bacterium]|nr:hypothetical protein [Burkholderiales bacterium]
MEPASTLQPRIAAFALALSFTAASSAWAQSNASQISEESLIPVAISVALPVVLVAGAGSIVVTGVQASADGVVWFVENVADGVKGSIRFAADAIGATAMVAGTVVVVTVVATGMLLSAAGHVIAFVPNEIGRSLSYNQRVSR